jgi:putative tricarboxylic transport membrane protein
MRTSDLTTGLIIMAGGLAVAGYAQTLPPMPGQPIGPSLFPTVIGVGLALAGAVLALSGLNRRATPWLELDAWARTPRALARVALVIIVLIAYTVVVDPLGFLITGVLFLSVLFAAFGARRGWILPIAIGVTVAIHYAFYTVLGVPLPWGVLEAIAW